MNGTYEDRYFRGIPRRLWKCGNCAAYEYREKDKMACWHNNPERGPCMHWKAKSLDDIEY